MRDSAVLNEIAGRRDVKAAKTTSDNATSPRFTLIALSGLHTGIAVVTGNDIWAVGWALTSAEILHWDGQAWTFSPTGSVGNYAGFCGVAAIASDDVWAFGGGSGRALADHWNGSVWQLSRTPRGDTTATPSTPGPRSRATTFGPSALAIRP